MYTRCENRIEKRQKIENKITPNPLKNDTNFKRKQNGTKNDTKTNLKRQCAEKLSKRVSKKRPKSGASNFLTYFSPLVANGLKMVANGSQNGADGGQNGANGGQNGLIVDPS